MTPYSDRTTESLDVVSLYAYVIEGGLLFVLSLYFSIIILLIRRLRRQKEYIVIAANMLFDSIFGLAYFSAGIYRLFIYYTEICKSTCINIYSKRGYDPPPLCRIGLKIKGGFVFWSDYIVDLLWSFPILDFLTFPLFADPCAGA